MACCGTNLKLKVLHDLGQIALLILRATRRHQRAANQDGEHVAQADPTHIPPFAGILRFKNIQKQRDDPASSTENSLPGKCGWGKENQNPFLSCQSFSQQ